jgi:hypothetical protein
MSWRAGKEPGVVLVRGKMGAMLTIDSRVDNDGEIEFSMDNGHFIGAYLGEDDRRKLIELLKTTLPEAEA